MGNQGIPSEGTVLEALKDANFRVVLDSGHELIAYSAGRMRMNRIRILAGDRVQVSLNPYDLRRGRIVYRHKG